MGYLENIDRYAAQSQIRRDAKMLWLEINRKLGNYDLIIEEIDKLLGLSEYSSIKIKLELERAKVYLDMDDFQTAQGYFESLTEDYTKKNETAEAYYHLGNIQLLQNFNLSLALELFEKSKEEKARSDYGKKSNEAKELIEDYTILVEDYKYLTEEQPAIEDSVFSSEDLPDSLILVDEFEMPPAIPQSNTDDVQPDSLLFKIGQMLYFDFYRSDSALTKYSKLIEEYPNSKFVAQSMYILNQKLPNNDWGTRLESEHPESEFVLREETDSTTTTETAANSLVYLRDSAWDLHTESYDAVKVRFLQIAEEYDDAISLYSAGFVADVYLNDLTEAVKIFKQLVHTYPDHEQSIIANDRINEVSSNIDSELHKIEQEKLFYNALSLIQDDYLLDSAKTVLDKVKSGENTSFKTTATSLVQQIGSLNQIETRIGNIVSDTSKIEIDTTNSNNPLYRELDSLYFEKANVFKIQLGLNDSAKAIYKYVIEEYVESSFRPYSILHLAELDSNINWNEYIFTEYPDTVFYLDSTIVINPLIATQIESDHFSKLDDKYKNIQSFMSIFDTVKVDSIIQFAVLENTVKDTLLVDALLPYFENTEFPWQAVYNWNEISISDSTLKTVFEMIDILQNNILLKVSDSYSEYEVIEGDNLGIIAEKVYNNYDAWTVLILDNEDILLNSDGKVTKGMTLKIRYEFKENR